MRKLCRILALAMALTQVVPGPSSEATPRELRAVPRLTVMALQALSVGDICFPPLIKSTPFISRLWRKFLPRIIRQTRRWLPAWPVPSVLTAGISVPIYMASDSGGTSSSSAGDYQRLSRQLAAEMAQLSGQFASETVVSFSPLLGQQAYIDSMSFPLHLQNDAMRVLNTWNALIELNPGWLERVFIVGSNYILVVHRSLLEGRISIDSHQKLKVQPPLRVQAPIWSRNPTQENNQRWALSNQMTLRIAQFEEAIDYYFNDRPRPDPFIDSETGLRGPSDFAASRQVTEGELAKLFEYLEQAKTTIDSGSRSDLRVAFEFARKLNPRFGSTLTPSLLARGDVPEFANLLREANERIFAPSNSLLIINDSQQRLLRLQIMPNTWQRLEYLESSIWVADFNTPLGPGQVAANTENYVALARDMLIQEGMKAIGMILLATGPYADRLHTWVQVNPRSPAQLIRLLSEDKSKYDAIQGAKGMVFVHRILMKPMAAIGFPDIVENILKPYSPLRNLLNVPAGPQQTAILKTRIKSILDYANHFASTLDHMNQLIVQNMLDDAYFRFLIEMLVMAALDRSIPTALSQWISFDLNLDGFDTAQNLLKRLERGGAHPAYYAFDLLRHIYRRHFYDHEDRQVVLKDASLHKKSGPPTFNALGAGTLGWFIKEMPFLSLSTIGLAWSLIHSSIAWTAVWGLTILANLFLPSSVALKYRVFPAAKTAA